MLSTTYEIYHFVDEGYKIRGVFLVILKAFDKVWHEGLIFKLNGISGNVLNISEDFPINKKEKLFMMVKHLPGKIFMKMFPRVLSKDHCYS